MTVNTTHEKKLHLDLDKIYPVQLGPTVTSRKAKESWHTFRYNFAPEKLLKSKGGYYEDENGNVSVEFAHELESESPHLFSGNQTGCKELDYLLIYDPETQILTLEKQASQVNLRNVRRARAAVRRPSLQSSKQPVEPPHHPHISHSDPDSELDEVLLQEMNRILDEDSDEEQTQAPTLTRRASLHPNVPSQTTHSAHQTTALDSDTLAIPTAIAASTSDYDSSTSSSHSSATPYSRHTQKGGSMSLKRKGLFGGTFDDANAEDSADDD